MRLRSRRTTAGLMLSAAVALTGCDYIATHNPFQRKADKDPVKVERARKQRQEVVADLALAPLPTGIPLVERDGKDSWGYPRSYVDGPALRSLLHHQKFTELTQYFEHFQREFEEDPLKEFWPVRAAETFDSAEAELLPKIDAWVSAMPFSFAPYLVRGTYRSAVAWARRGSEFAKDTAKSDFDAMREPLPLARKDLERARELAPKSIAVDRGLISVAQLLGDRDLIKSAFEHGMQACPGCLSLRTMYMGTLLPRWGGSLEAMEHFARTQQNPAFPRLKVLLALPDHERAWAAWHGKRLEEALRYADEACKVDHWEVLDRRAGIHAALKDFPKALADMDRAVEMRPDLPGLRMNRADYRARADDWVGAAEDLLIVIRVDTTNANARRWRPRVASGLNEAAWKAHEAGKREEAVKLIELAEQLAPWDKQILRRKLEIVRGGAAPQQGDPIAALEAAIREHPDDFRAHQKLDYEWARKHQYNKIIPMWTAYLERHPNDGQAYFERSGAYHNSGHKPEAFADVEKACTLGVDAACSFAKRFPR